MKLPQQQVYFYPYQHGNQFVENTKRCINLAGFGVLEIRQLFTLQNMFGRKHKTVVFNWLEDSPYASNLSGLSSFTRFLRCIILLVLAKIYARKIIWIRHNFKPHNRNKTLVYFKSLCWLLDNISHKILVLEEYAVEVLASSTSDYMPHPLYESTMTHFQKASKQVEHDDIAKKLSDFAQPRDICAGYYGSIKPYKNLDALLKVWPNTIKLIIKGQCNDTKYEKKLRSIIAQRNLLVEFTNVCLTDSQYEQLLTRTKFVVLAHSSDSMISSGTFYHAISYGCNLILGPSKFAAHKIQQYDFCFSLAQDVLSPQTSLLPNNIEPRQVYDAAIKDYGNAHLIRCWQAILQ